MDPNRTRHNTRRVATASVAAAIILGCTAQAPPPMPIPVLPPAIATLPAPSAVPTLPTLPLVSGATNARDYRRDAAIHLYAQNVTRIYHGKLPPLLYAIGVLQVNVDGKGRVMSLDWMRAPAHAPEVIAEIERLVRQAAPYPAPARMGRVTYTDTWLWHVSGRFQLDTLTEGQL